MVGGTTVHDRRWAILGVLVVSLLVVVLDNTILNVALPTIERTLRASQSQQEWIIDSYTLVFAGLLFTWGVLGDRYGRKRMLQLGLALFGAGSVAAAFSSSPGMLVATRALMGIGGAAVLPSTLSVITNVFAAAERPRAIAIWAGFSGMAVAIGPITGGALLEHFWWGSVFLVNVPVVVLGITAIALIVPESSNPRPQRLHVPGVVLSIAGLVSLVYGIIKGGQHGDWGSPPVLATLLGGIAVLAVFVATQARSDHPVLDVTLFRNPAFSAASAAITLVFFALFGATFYLTFYLQFIREYSPLSAGVRLLPVALALAFFAPRSARMVRRFGAKAVCTTGLLLVTAAFLCYQLVGVGGSIWKLEALLFLQGMGMANVMAPATESIMSTLPRERAGAGSAVNNTVRQVGGALGVAVLGSLLSSSYRAAVEPALSPLPPGLRTTAGESIGATKAVAAQLGEQGRALLDPAKDAFVHAMHVTSLGSALVAFVGALVVLRWLPGRAAPAGPAATADRAAHEEVPTA
ncbi:MAG TPA: DHA2 family efflux MFS transporter permease subunit [Frankiaceae bacterium]|nr:DHA2 family efflux MFS transporter permease subunit [Frankiaceae bacterium]